MMKQENSNKNNKLNQACEERKEQQENITNKNAKKKKSWLDEVVMIMKDNVSKIPIKDSTLINMLGTVVIGFVMWGIKSFSYAYNLGKLSIYKLDKNIFNWMGRMQF